MDYNTKLIDARLDAIESILHSLASQDASALERIRLMLSNECGAARATQTAPRKGGLQTAVMFEMPPARDTLGEAAKTAAYEQLCRKFGAPF